MFSILVTFVHLLCVMVKSISILGLNCESVAAEELVKASYKQNNVLFIIFYIIPVTIIVSIAYCCVLHSIEHYHEFKLEVHRLFPTVIDTKHVCYAVQKV